MGEWNNHTLIYLKVKDQDQIKFWIDVLEIREEKCTIFREPDLNNEITAIASYGDGKIFKGLSLL